jgi:hypothetical protein
MLKRLFIVILFLTGSLRIVAQNDTTLIKKCYADFKNVVQKHQGQSARSLVDSSTMRYFSALANKIKKADRAVIEKSNSYDKLIILTIRHYVSKERLLKMQGKELFLYVVDSGGIPLSYLEKEIGNIKVTGKSAIAQMLSDRNPAAYYDFRKEAGAWKLNLLSLLAVREKEEKSRFELFGKTDLEMILQSLNSTSRKPVGPELFEPLIKK